MSKPRANPIAKERSRMVSAIAWGVAVLLAPTSSAWILGQWVYWFDVLASQQMLISWVVLAAALFMLIARRRPAGALCILFASISFYPILIGRTMLLPGVDLEHKPEDRIRIITSNIHPKNTEWEHDIGLLLASEADVLVLIEAPWGLFLSIREHGLLDSTPYPFWVYRRLVGSETSRSIILSRWPLEVIDSAGDPNYAQDYLYARVRVQSGDFVVGVLHPMSPRTRQRWIEGNEVLEAQANAADALHRKLRVPIFIGADLNAGPAQRRARTLRRHGLEMSKPMLRAGGSFPAGTALPMFMRVQIDDVWTLGDITPRAWGMIELSGSDHLAVIADFRINE